MISRAILRIPFAIRKNARKKQVDSASKSTNVSMDVEVSKTNQFVSLVSTKSVFKRTQDSH